MASSFSLIRTFLIALSISIGAFVLFVFLEPNTHSVSSSTIAPALAKTETQTPEVPLRLLIPVINVAADVQHVGLAPGDTATMDVPSNFTDVGWYKEGPRPGAIGSAVIDGHLNGKNVPEAVFFRLDLLTIGDSVYIVDEAMNAHKFRVTDVRTYKHNDPTDDVFTNTEGKSHLNLITCAGTWMKDAQLYDRRTVVFTELVTE